jgi:hypothetical protein
MNIFYDNVDANLQTELNARGQAGMMDRTTKSLDFMLGKIANVQLTAYEGTGSASTVVPLHKFGVLGGATTAASRYLPSGIDGYLTDRDVNRTQISFYGDAGTMDDYNAAMKNSPNELLGQAYNKKLSLNDTSKRVGPYLANVDINIGDHSMGLLNKATVSLIIPNPERDLDLVETTWFRPGRFVRIDIVHPDSALVSRDITQGFLTSGSVPNKSKLKELYPGWDIDELQKQIRRMNVFTFEGLITSFEFSYAAEGTVEASLSLTGTSNVYADVSMYMALGGQKDTKTNATVNTDFAITAAAPTRSLEIVDAATGKKSKIIIQDSGSNMINGQNEFVAKLYTKFQENVDTYKKKNSLETKPTNELQLLIPFTTEKSSLEQSDRFILAGELYATKTYTIDVPIPTTPTASGAPAGPVNFDTSSFITQFGGELTTKIDYYPNGSLNLLTNNFEPSAKITVTSKAEYERYITLGALIQFINDYAAIKYNQPNQLKPVGIVCTDSLQKSNYYTYLTSCRPNEILLLPADPSKPADMNWHGDLGYYKDVVRAKNKQETTPTLSWFGIYEKLSNNVDIILPSRIFINLQTIERIVNLLSAKSVRAFTISQFLSSISNEIAYATGNAITMKLISDPNDQNRLMFVDSQYLKSADPNSTKNVNPYVVPMFANHPKGSIVRDFQFSANLPESAKNLSYVLNSGEDISTDQIAPYMNFMYNSGDAAAINKAMSNYKQRHLDIIANLKTVKEKNGAYPLVKENINQLYKALTDYIKIPTTDIRKSQQITAPIFPFTAEFTIDGINGFKYGDVVTFHALPERYRVNTVFSVIGVGQTVSSQGEWTTSVKCIMRPSLD